MEVSRRIPEVPPPNGVVGSAAVAGRFLPLLGERNTTIRIVALAHDMRVTIAADRKRGVGT